jgi:hypothetical protein
MARWKGLPRLVEPAHALKLQTEQVPAAMIVRVLGEPLAHRLDRLGGVRRGCAGVAAWFALAAGSAERVHE